MISEKDRMIVDTVNQLHGMAPSKSENTVWYSRCEYFDFGIEKTKQIVCTISEYNECIKEMTDAKWMKKQVVSHYILIFADGARSSVHWDRKSLPDAVNAAKARSTRAEYLHKNGKPKFRLVYQGG